MPHARFLLIFALALATGALTIWVGYLAAPAVGGGFWLILPLLAAGLWIVLRSRT